MALKMKTIQVVIIHDSFIMTKLARCCPYEEVRSRQLLYDFLRARYQDDVIDGNTAAWWATGSIL